jgi:hypothetical protein
VALSAGADLVPVALGWERPTRIGSLWKNHQERCLESVISMPEDVLPSLLPMLLAERLRYVVLNGTPLFRRQAEIRSYRFEAIVDFDNYAA